jgi:uncharacterized YigZ family protein
MLRLMMGGPSEARGSSGSGGESPPGDGYQTLAGPAEAERKVRRSRFLARAAPAATPEAAREEVAAMGRRYHDCRHVCHAWRLGHGPALREGRSDGGEPAGTAGEPLLAALRHADVTDAVVVVARYFGGIKLGTGGLARAYGEAGAAALAAAPRRLVVQGGEHVLRFGYALRKTMAGLLAAHDGRIVEESYAASVTWRVWLPTRSTDRFAEAVREATAGEVTLEEGSDGQPS